MVDYKARCEVLEAENEQLREEMALLRAEFQEREWKPDPVLGLTGKEAELVRILLKRKQATKEQIHHFLYALEGQEAEMKIVDVFVCKVRKKLTPFGIEIATLWGQGYSLTDTGRDILWQMDDRKNYISLEQLKAVGE